ncbi:MotA/TolQ/ExbB proton channel family protein, partial [Escherichia coli]|nr:MotA/TolQ/ExbB proton channel family protein [Escherichia coli]
LALSSVLAVLGKAPRFTASTTNILTSLGILGTFAGIVVGLMEFNPSDIDGSIESLLAGLKTAFLTSLVGMAASIVYKAILG